MLNPMQLIIYKWKNKHIFVFSQYLIFLFLIAFVSFNCKTKESNRITNRYHKIDAEELLAKHEISDLINELKAREIQCLINGSKRTDTVSTKKYIENNQKRITKYGNYKLLDSLRDISSHAIFMNINVRQKAIYDIDDRKDIFEMQDSPDIIRNADGVVSIWKKRDLIENNPNPGRSKAITKKFGLAFNLCAEEPFKEQPIGCIGSGFLVSSDLIITAGHCVNRDNVKMVCFIFGYRMIDPNTALTDFNNDDIYFAKEVIDSIQESEEDWALVRLDREVKNHKPVVIQSSAKIEEIKENQELYVIGHGCGLPAKYSGNANVRSISNNHYFIANLDTFAGNSGSPIFDRTTNKAIGILVRGEKDFVRVGSCNRSFCCPTTGCRGEDCTRITEVFLALKRVEIKP